MLGFTITTRMEPRWIESTFYNIHNILTVFIMFGFIIYLYKHKQSVIELTPDSLLIDELDILPLFSRTQFNILKQMLNEKPVTCAELRLTIDKNFHGNCQDDCIITPSSCKYHNLSANAIWNLLKNHHYKEVFL